MGGGLISAAAPETVRRDRRRELLSSACDARHGVIPKAQVALAGVADLPGIWHVGVPHGTGDAWRSASGGVGRDLASARAAAIGEALERYAAVVCELSLRSRADLDVETVLTAADFSLLHPDQVAAHPAVFASVYGDDADYAEVFSLVDNAPAWVPHELVGLRGEGGLGTSSGLAAHATMLRALLRATEELVERDALMVSWLHSVPGRQVALPGRYTDDVAALGGQVTCIDATPAYSPHPVALVAGSLSLRGTARYSLGAACRSTWEAAVEKAYLEWVQGVFFVGAYLGQHPGLRFDSYDDVDSFDAHAVYYTTAPREWANVALLHGRSAPPPPACPGRDGGHSPRPPQAARAGAGGASRSAGRHTSTAEELERLVTHLAAAGVRLWYRDLTTVDLRQLGMHAVRVLSPDLTPIFCHPRMPFLGGRTADVLWRYPWAESVELRYPNPMPHPLG